jgi:beta-lactam-binding protein with PASTA domain/predicted Ser/Thr protein kinase
MASARKGTVVDERYKLTRKVGTGGMADVWLATDTELDREVAIKILHDRFAQDTEFVERFQREARSAAGLQHPNVVGVFDRGEFRDTYFIAMEYVDGPSLKDLVKGGMSVPDAVAFVEQILAAAKFAHRKGIVHRDLKPQNVLIDEEGRAKVADFGIAGGEASDITQAGTVMGTAEYLSPEQAEGRETTPRSDIYSIGVILYEALTGTVPFKGDSAVSVALKQVTETPKRPSAINPKVPPALDAVVMRALSKDPGERFKDADAFKTALDAAMKNPDKPRRQDAAALAAAETADTQIRDAGEDPESDEEASARKRRRNLIIAGVLVAVVAGLVAFFLTRPGSVTVPNVTGLTSEVAVVRLEEEGLDAEIDPIPNLATRNTVLEQDPLPESVVDEGSTVTLSVSTGPALVEIPDVSGLGPKEARKRLEDQGLVVSLINKPSDTVPKGLVTRTDPAAGTEISVGSTVKLVVSSGTAKSTVPDLVGSQLDPALAELESAGLTANVVQQDVSAPAGEVVDQAPSAGTKVKKGSQVTIFVSSGAVVLPDVIGEDRSTAVKRLKKLGLVVVVRIDSTSPPEDFGLVVDQYPSAASRVQRGDTVTLTVGGGS